MVTIRMTAISALLHLSRQRRRYGRRSMRWPPAFWSHPAKGCSRNAVSMRDAAAGGEAVDRSVLTHRGSPPDQLMLVTADMLRHYHLAISSGVGSVSSLLGWTMMCLSPLRMSTGPPMTFVNTVRGTVCQPCPIISATLVAWLRETINRSPCAGLRSAFALPLGGRSHAPNASLSRPCLHPA